MVTKLRCRLSSSQPSLTHPSKIQGLVELCDHQKGWDGVGREVQEGEDIYILKVESRYCMAETNTIL